MNREQLLKPLTVKTSQVPVPEFGEGEVLHVHGLTAKEHNKYQASLMKRDWTGIDRNKATQQKERLLVACIRDESGAKIFNDSDIEMIGEWPADLVNRLHDEALRLVGGQDEVSEELAAKNSLETTAA